MVTVKKLEEGGLRSRGPLDTPHRQILDAPFQGGHIQDKVLNEKKAGIEQKGVWAYDQVQERR